MRTTNNLERRANWALDYRVMSNYTSCKFLGTYGRCDVTEKLSTLDIRQRLGDILNRVALRHDQFIIERKGKPLAAMVPVERLEQMQEAARLHLLDTLSRRSGKVSQAEADRLADEAKHRTRKARHK